MKSWLAQGSSGKRVTLLPGTTFLHISRQEGGANSKGVGAYMKEGAYFVYTFLASK